MLVLFIAAGGCMPHIINVPPGKEMDEEPSRAGVEPNRQELQPSKEPRKSLTEPRIAAPTADLRATTRSSTKPEYIVASDQPARVASALPELQEIASRQTSAAGFVPGPAEAHAITDSNDGSSAAWSAVVVLAVVAALLLVTRLIGRRSVPIVPDKPLAKLLHTRPWR